MAGVEVSAGGGAEISGEGVFGASSVEAVGQLFGDESGVTGPDGGATRGAEGGGGEAGGNGVFDERGEVGALGGVVAEGDCVDAGVVEAGDRDE